MKRFGIYLCCLCVVSFCFLSTSVEAIDVYKIINIANKNIANKQFSNDDERYKNALQNVYDYNGGEIKPNDKFDVFLDLYGTLSHWQKIKENTYAESLQLIVASLSLMLREEDWPYFLGISDDEINTLRTSVKKNI